MLDEADSAYYRWQPPGKAVAVSLSLAVVERLEPIVRQDEEPASHRRPEIGGFLWGVIKRVHGLTTVRVDGFELVECEHASGPSYFLSGADQNRLADRLRRTRLPRGAAVVGFFRSNTRKVFALSVEDIDLMARYFAKPSMVLLLVHAAPVGSLRGGFSIWEEKAIRTLKPYQEFPFDSHALLADGYEVAGREPARAIAPAPLAVQRRLLAPQHPIALPNTGKDLMRPVGGLTAASRQQAKERFAGDPENSWRSTVVRVRVEAGTMVTIHRAAIRFLQLLPNRMRIEWLVAMAAVAIALLGGVLHRGLRLPASPLPSIAQSRRAAERPAQEADRESPLRVATVPAPSPVDTPATAPPGPPAPADPELELAVEAPAVLPTPQPGAANPQPAAPARAAVVPAARPLAASLPTPSLPAPPNVAWEPPKSPALVVPESSIPPAAVGTASDPFVSIAVNPLPGHRKLLGKLFSGRKEAAAIEPPRLLEKSAPDVPRDLRDRIRGTVPVTVKLYLDRAGRVEYAELLSNGTGANRELAALAVFASRKWQFAPARQGGEAIPAEVLVEFRFGAAANPPDRIASGQRGEPSRSIQ